MNRQQRRSQQKAAPSYMRGTNEQRKAALYKNGITIEDLAENHRIGYSEGYKAASDTCMRTCYAAAAVAMRRIHGLDAQGCAEVVREIDTFVAHYLTSDEAIKAAFEETGLEIDFTEPFV